MSEQPFTGIYSAALKDMCRSIDPKDFVLFMFLCAHADHRGVCYPGVKMIGAALGWRFDEVRFRLDRLERQSLLRFLRRGVRDEITGKFTPDVYGMNPRVYLAKHPVTQYAENAELAPVTYIAENTEPDQLRIAPVDYQQPESEPEASTKSIRTRISNHHHQPDEISSDERNAGTGDGWNGWQDEEKANTNQIPQTKANANTNAIGHQPEGAKPAFANHAKGNTPPSSAPPPEWTPEGRYVNALADARLEALANEIRAQAPTKLYNAREMVMHYGEEQVRKGLAQLAAAKAKGGIYNPYGLLTTWLRTGSVKAEPAALTNDYTSGEYGSFIKS